MGKTSTNIAIVLGLITVVFAGYWLYSQNGSDLLSTEPTNEQTMENMLNNTNAFIGHRQVLNGIKLDLTILEDKRFVGLRSFTTPIEEADIGRENPFSGPFESTAKQP